MAGGLSTRLKGLPAAVNPHAAYAVRHLSSAFFASAVFSAAVGLAYVLTVESRERLESRSTAFFLGGIGLLFCVFWLPVLLAGGFVQDDWLLLAAASVRHVIVAHPITSWWALDSVDGNFRPLGTVLYISTLYRVFGLAPRIFLLGNFLLNLGTVVTAYLVVRQFGYPKVAGAVAAALYLSRGVLYTQSGWVSALGDCIVDFLTALVVLFLLKAIRTSGPRSWTLQGAAWTLYVVSMLAKQSSYTTPLVVAALLWIRPGTTERLAWKTRAAQATATLTAYGAPAVVVLYHAKSLLGHQTPYPVGLTGFAALRSFAYVFWYFETLYVPSNSLFHRAHAAGPLDLAGFLLVALLAFLLVRYPWLMGERPRDLWFVAVAGGCSVLPFLLVAERNEAYYGTMLAFWLSLGFAILLTRVRAPGPRRLAGLGFCALMVLSFLDVRLKQIGSLWPGGYFWGDADVSAEGARFEELRRIVAGRQDGQTAILIDPPMQPRFYASMLMLLTPKVERIFIYNSRTGTYLENNRGGLLPGDGVAALRDVNAYKWLTPVAPARAADLAGERNAMWIQYRGDGFAAVDARAAGGPAVAMLGKPPGRSPGSPN